MPVLTFPEEMFPGSRERSFVAAGLQFADGLLAGKLLPRVEARSQQGNGGRKSRLRVRGSGTGQEKA